MIRINSENGVIRLGPFSFFWQNPEPEYPGFAVLAYGDTSIEFGEIDAGNGIFVTRFKDGEIFFQHALLRLP